MSESNYIEYPHSVFLDWSDGEVVVHVGPGAHIWSAYHKDGKVTWGESVTTYVVEITPEETDQHYSWAYLLRGDEVLPHGFYKVGVV